MLETMGESTSVEWSIGGTWKYDTRTKASPLTGEPEILGDMILVKLHSNEKNKTYGV
jgi:hypothetical protein